MKQNLRLTTILTIVCCAVAAISRAENTAAPLPFKKFTIPSGSSVPSQNKTAITTNSSGLSEARTSNYDPASALKARVLAAPRDVGARMQLARYYEPHSKWDDVIETLAPVSDILAKDGIFLMARAYAYKAQYDRELRLLEMLLQKQPKDAAVLMRIGEAYEHNKRGGDAVEAFIRAKQLAPNSLIPYQALINRLEQEKDLAAARGYAQEVIRRFPSAAATYQSKVCRYYSEEGFLKQTITACLEAIKRDPNNADNHVFLAKAYVDREDSKLGEVKVNDTARRFPASYNAQATAGQISFDKKNYLLAYQYFARALAISPRSTAALLGYAKAAIEIERKQEAADKLYTLCLIDRGMARDIRLIASDLRQRKDLIYSKKIEDNINKCGIP